MSAEGARVEAPAPWGKYGRRSPDPLPLRLGSGERAVPFPENFSWMKMACSGAFWDTVLKKTCLQQKASHQTSIHCVYRYFVKIRVCDARGPSPHISNCPMLYVTK